MDYQMMETNIYLIMKYLLIFILIFVLYILILILILLDCQLLFLRKRKLLWCLHDIMKIHSLTWKKKSFLSEATIFEHE